ncbi:right-handed parallel beta-helix repeat-containing protein [Psychromonas antarctica]|uniref:right-handed parallel beta-helix repeat-containing protein n=1 Tax=Psychromonas antarctica TaxID=67573 RepID=UPI001EE7C8E5|nr:right-handed parallel beta-helix repeat-containing protein [Psychromonas antarctica]MCG6201303.1 hypothetical protein [Psychromonas antarctica]
MPKRINILILLSALFSSVISANSYVMPIGIPEAKIKFTETSPARPSNWSIEVPGYYYINYQNGNDAFPFGSELLPRKTIPKILPAGSYVEIAGEYYYTSGGVIKVYGEGTIDQWKANVAGPIWITGAKDNPGRFINAKTLVWGSNIYLTDMIIEKNSKIQVGSGTDGYAANNIVIKNNSFIGTLEMGNGALLSVLGAKNTPSKNIILYDNSLKDAGDINNETDIDAGLIVISGYSSYIWALKNIGQNASGGGLQINPRPPRDASHHIYAGNNEFFNVRQGGLWVKYATNVVFSSNYVHDIISTPWSPAKGLGAQYEPNGLWIINNRIHDVEYGIRIPSTNNIDKLSLKVYIIGNIIYNIHTESEVGTSSAWESAGIHIQGADERYIYNNLIYNAPNGINVSATSGQTTIKNNIVLKVNNGHAAGEQGFQVWSEHHNSLPDISISNNFFNSNDMKVKLTSQVFTTVNSLNNYLNSKNYSGSLDIEQLGLTNVLTNGFTENTLWDFGVNVFPELSTTLAATVDSTLKLNFDILNNSRISGNSVDIGPFEKVGANPNIADVHIPAKPDSVSISIE